MPREYTTAKAFRTALEDRLNKTAGAEKIQVNRLRRQVAFDRLLARLFRTDPAPWVLKGGYALELHFRTARATIDIDLTVQRVAAATEDDANQIVRDMLQNAASFRLGDWFEYTIGAPAKDLDAAPYGGARYPVETWMDGGIFARFHRDAGIGDAFVALETLHEHPRRLSHGVCQLCLATAGWSLDEQRLLHAGREIHHFQGHLVDDILGLAQLAGELLL